MAWAIFVHSVRQVFGNLNAALRVSVVLMAVQFAVTMWFTGTIAEIVAAGPEADIPQGVLGPQLLAFLVVAAITGPWVAVAWHRYVLLEEHPGAAVPRWDGARWMAYLFALVQLFLVVLLAMVALSMVAGFVLALFPVAGAGILVAPLLVVPIAYLGYRLSLVLPAAALGEPMTLRQSWNATIPGANTILGLTFLVLAASLFAQVAGGALLSSSYILGMAVRIVLSWAAFMIGISVMTTLYGHYVQGRALV